MFEEVIYMSDDEKKKSKPVYRFDNEDWSVPASRDEIKNKKTNKFKKESDKKSNS